MGLIYDVTKLAVLTNRRRVNEDGEVVHEKIPATVQNERRSRRWVLMLDAAGNEVAVPLTTGASWVEPVGPYRDHKWRRMVHRDGWIPVGRCPIAMAAAGEASDRFLAKATREIPGCHDPKSYNESSPCPHVRCERDIRRARHRKIEIERDSKHQDPAAAAIREQNDLLRKDLLHRGVLAQAEEPSRPAQPQARKRDG